ncbi:TPA: hypothetical protein ACH3X3_011957 [Trebouxia sp. C0006]
MAFAFGTPSSSAQSSGFNFGASTSSGPSFGFGASASPAATPAFGISPGKLYCGARGQNAPLHHQRLHLVLVTNAGGFGASTGASLFGSNTSSTLFGGASSASGQFAQIGTPAFGQASTSAFGSFGQSQPSLFGMAQQPQQQNQQQLSLFGTSQQPQQQNQQQSNLFGQNQQPAPYNAAQLAAGVAPASQEIVAISRAFDKQSSEYRFRHLFLNVIDDPRRYPCPKGVGDLEWREATNKAGGVSNPNRLWPVAVSGFDELMTRKTVQDGALKLHAERLANAVNMARTLQRNEETLLKDRMETIKRNHVGLSDQLLRIMRALDALEGRFAEASNHHSSKTHQVHETLSHDLSQLEAVLAPNSAVGLLSRAEALSAASSMQGDAPVQRNLQSLSQSDINDVQQMLIDNTKVLTKLQEVLRKDNRDIAIMAEAQHNDDLALMVT